MTVFINMTVFFSLAPGLLIAQSIALSAKSAPLPLVRRAAPCDWCEGHLITIGGKGTPLPSGWWGIFLLLVGGAPHCHLMGRASQLPFGGSVSYWHRSEGHPVAIWWAGIPLAYYLLGIFQGWHTNYEGIMRTP